MPVGPDETNWRRAYHLQIEDAIRDYREERADPRSFRQVRIPGEQRTRSIHSLTDAEIDFIARREAEADLDRAIHQHNARAS